MIVPEGSPVGVTARDGELVITLPVESVTSLAGLVSDTKLAARLPECGAEIAGAFTGWLAEPQPPKDAQRVRVVRIILTRSVVVGQTVIELAEPVQVHA